MKSFLIYETQTQQLDCAGIEKEILNRLSTQEGIRKKDLVSLHMYINPQENRLYFVAVTQQGAERTGSYDLV